MASKKLKYPTPGEIILEEFLRPLGISQYRLAIETGMPHSRITAIIKGRQGITADTALRLARFFNCDPKNWLNLQIQYDLRMADSAKHTEYLRIRPCTALA